MINMESNPNEDYSKSSSDEEETDNRGTAWRAYECMFCKRGFNTAQALGGHMNIHRKYRAKNMPQTSSSSSSSISDKFVVDNNNNNNYYNKNYASFRSVIPSYPTTHNHHDQYFGMASEVQANYQTYFPSSTNSYNHINNYDSSYGKNHQQLNVFGDEIWQRNLGLSVGESHHVAAAAAGHENEKRSQGVGEKDELDLELRLGHHPVLF